MEYEKLLQRMQNSRWEKLWSAVMLTEPVHSLNRHPSYHHSPPPSLPPPPPPLSLPLPSSPPPVISTVTVSISLLLFPSSPYSYAFRSFSRI